MKSPFGRSFWLGASLALGALPAVAQPPVRPAPSTAAPPLRFKWVGPEPAGRIAAVAGVPGDTSTYYFGAASGGIWKTTDGARTFAPIFDEQPVQAIGALAVAPSNPRIVWAGTGEAWAIRDSDVMGDGIYKSTDGGATWKNMGLAETGRIGRIVIHPANPDIVLACTLGRATGPQEERGVFRTTDGGTTWTRVLFVDPNTGCSGLAMDVAHPAVLFAGTWDVVMHTWMMRSGGPGSGVWVSRDTGATWSRLADPGLPHAPLGKIDVAVAPSNSKRVYALIQTPDQGSLWRSDDGGGKWKVVSWDRRLIGRAGYYIRLAVNPQNDLEVLVLNSSFHRSFDGGETFPPDEGGCGDCHDVWIDPQNPSHWVLTDDGGAAITRDHGQHYGSVRLPIGQMYHVAIDDRAPYWIYSNRQDDGTMRGPSDRPVPLTNVPGLALAGGGGRGTLVGVSDSLRQRLDSLDTARPAGSGSRFNFGRGDGDSAWQGGLGGCESGFTLPTPGNNDIIWSSCYGNKVTRFDNRAGRARSVSPGIHTLDSPPDQIPYRCHWTPPLAIDPFDPATVYYGCQVIFKTATGGQSWSVISPDLSTGDPSRVVSSGGIVGDNLGQFYGEVVFAIAPSSIRRGLIWAGTNDGKIWYTTTGGSTWIDVTNNVTGMPAWGTVRKIEPSRFDPAAAYLSVDFHLMDDRAPYLFKTADYGKTWTRISAGLPSAHPLSYAMSIAENPNRKGMLFAGTGNGFYYSMNDGNTWTAFRAGLPAAPVTWIVVAKDRHDVIVSTYGRGLFVLSDITALEQADRLTGAPVQLFEPRAGWRMARDGQADFTALVKATPKDSVKLEVLDSAGAVIRTTRYPARAGLNRYGWDLQYDGPKQIELRTTPPDNPNIWAEARFRDKKTRPIIHWGIEGPERAGPLAAPGRYTGRLTVDSVAYLVGFRILKDPEIKSNEADLRASTAAQIRIRDNVNRTVETVNGIEILRKQLEDQAKANQGRADLTGPLAAFDRKLLDIEMVLLSKSDLHSDDKWYVEKYRTYLNLVWLSGEVGTGAGDVAGGAEFRPTDASMATLAKLELEVAGAVAAFARIVATDLPAFNQQMAGRIPALSVKAP